MFRYMNFLNKTMIRKKGIWITAIIGFALFCVLTYYQIKDANQNGNNSLGAAKINSLNSFDFFIPFVFGTLVSAFIVMHCFKEGESDGTELIIVAKPLTRAQIIAGKFFTTILFLIAYQFACAIIYTMMSLLDKEASTNDKINFVLSLTVGGFIVQLFAVGIITLLASLLGKIGTIVMSVMFAALIPIVSFIAAPISGAYRGIQHINDANHDKKYFITGYDKKAKKYLSTPVNSIYKRDIVDAKKDEEKNNYGFISKIDPWYQWGRFYRLFISRPSNGSDFLIINWHVKKTVIPNLSTFPIIVNDKEEQFALKLDKNNLNNNKDESTADISALANDFWNNGLTIYKETHANVGDEINTQKKFQDNFASMSWVEKYHRISETLNDNPNRKRINAITPTFIIRYLEKNYNVPLSKIDSKNVPYGMINVNDIYTIETSDYIPTNVVVIIWTIIGLLLLSASAFVYTKRDFK